MAVKKEVKFNINKVTKKELYFALLIAQDDFDTLKIKYAKKVKREKRFIERINNLEYELNKNK